MVAAYTYNKHDRYVHDRDKEPKNEMIHCSNKIDPTTKHFLRRPTLPPPLHTDVCQQRRNNMIPTCYPSEERLKLQTPSGPYPKQEVVPPPPAPQKQWWVSLYSAGFLFVATRVDRHGGFEVLPLWWLSLSRS